LLPGSTHQASTFVIIAKKSGDFNSFFENETLWLSGNPDISFMKHKPSEKESNGLGDAIFSDIPSSME